MLELFRFCRNVFVRVPIECSERYFVLKLLGFRFVELFLRVIRGYGNKGLILRARSFARVVSA